MQQYEVDFLITLIDGTEVVENAKIQSPSQEKAKNTCGELVQQLGVTGVLKLNEQQQEFVLDPPPSMIRRIRAQLRHTVAPIQPPPPE
jgi:hypothetical protein